MANKIVWPKCDELSQLHSEVEEALGPISIRDISEHPGGNIRTLTGGRWDAMNNTVWISPKLEDVEKLYAISHEIAHAWQTANKYPRVYAVHNLEEIGLENQGLYEIIGNVFYMADHISEVVLDPAADHLLLERSIVRKETIPIPLPGPQEKFNPFSLNLFSERLSIIPQLISDKTIMTPIQALLYWKEYGLGVVDNACILAAARMRLEQVAKMNAEAFKVFYSYGDDITNMTFELNKLIENRNIISPGECRTDFESILRYLNIPKEVMTIS